MAKQTFTTGQVLTAAQMTSLQQTAMLGGAASAKTASYTLVAADAGTAISMSNASATTITVNTGLFAAGDTVQITNLGAGVCTITAGTATVNTSASLALAQYESGTLDFTSTSAAIFIKGAGAAASAGVTYAVFRDEKTAGTDGGTQTSGAYYTRDLNTTSYNGITGASLASNQVTLAAGTYYVEAIATHKGPSGNLRWYNITDSASAVAGQTNYFEAWGEFKLVGVFTIAASKVFELQYRVSGTTAGNGLGVKNSYQAVEVYSMVTIVKVA
jgi:hypothetical protein